MLPRATSYEELRRAFRWDVPARCNIAVDCCDRHADGGAADRVALIEPDAGGGTRRWTFGMLKRQSNRLANVLRAHGVERGGRTRRATRWGTRAEARTTSRAWWCSR